MKVRTAVILVAALLALAAPRVHALALAQDPPAACAERPEPPTNLKAAIDVASLTLTWEAPAHGCAPRTYIIEAKCACFAQGFREVPTTSAATIYTYPNVPSDTFAFHVRAVNAAGKSDLSNEVSLKVPRWGDHSTPDVVVAAGTSERSTYFPTVERLKNGHLLTVYYDSPEHVSQLGRIALVQSTDEGRHWSAPRAIVDTPNDDRDPSIMQMGDGTLLLNFFAVDRTNDWPLPLGVFVSRSADDGVGWSAPVHVETTLAGAATSAKIIELDNGDLLLPLYGVAPGTEGTRAAVIRSTDGGRTWPAAGQVELASPPGVDFSEPALVSLGGSRLLTVIRAERGDNSAFAARSEDGGRTWSPPQRLGVVAQAPDLLPIRIAGDPRLRVLFAYGELSDKFGEGRRTAMELDDPDIPYASTGKTIVYHGHCSWGDESYPSSVRISETQVFTVYYDACAGIIGGTYSSLSSMTRAR